MAEKNIAYLVREDVKTIGVRFYEDSSTKRVDGLSTGEYTYVTNLEFKLNDLAVVRAANDLKVVVVTRVDSTCLIEPNSSIKYSWVIDKVDVDSYEKQLDINEKIESVVNSSYKKNVARQFKQLVLADMDEQSANTLKALLGDSSNASN